MVGSCRDPVAIERVSELDLQSACRFCANAASGHVVSILVLIACCGSFFERTTCGSMYPNERERKTRPLSTNTVSSFFKRGGQSPNDLTILLFSASGRQSMISKEDREIMNREIRERCVDRETILLALIA